MNGYAAIADFGKSIRKLLQDEFDNILSHDNRVEVTADSPKRIQDRDKTESRLLSVNIYRIVENADLRNMPIYQDESSNTIRSIGLDAYLLLTAYGPDSDTTLLILGIAQQFLHNLVLTGSRFISSQTDNNNQSIKITQQPLSQELITQMWQAMECSMRLALYYLATPILIDVGERSDGSPVSDRQLGQDDGGEIL